jgi:hypothetical protein
MTASDLPARLLETLSLKRLDDDRPAGLLIASVPVPRAAPLPVAFAGRTGFAKPLGRWPDTDSPRRILLLGDNQGPPPQSLSLTRNATHADWPAPIATMETFAHAPAADLPLYYWERSLLKISWGGKTLSLAMGARVKGQLHWWEACNLRVISQSPACLEIQMAGVIPHEVTTKETMDSFAGKDNPFIHKHNWLNAQIYARLHANGVCEFYARHINSMFADDGADLPHTLPVIGFQIHEFSPRPSAFNRTWDGTAPLLNLGDVQFDLTDTARLATPAQPGNLTTEDGFIVLQPYQGVQVAGGPLTDIRIGSPYFWQAHQEIFPRGMARTLRFSTSLNPQRSPRIARYIAPSWWYGLCEEFQPRPLLPVSNEFNQALDNGRLWFHKFMTPAGFSEGMTPQSHPPGDLPDPAATPSAEGDVQAGMFQMAYRTADPLDFDCALRSAFCMADVFVDHTTKRTRFPGHQVGATALPLQRMHGAIAAWLETGDPYLLDTAIAVTDNAYWWHKNSWPRRAVGRDARFTHTQMVLYRYLGSQHYLDRTRDVINDLAVAQWPNGSFGDQAGGSGIHGYGNYIIKPWMGYLATFGVLDYLEHFPDDPTANLILRKFTDWLMRERAPRVINPRDPSSPSVIGWTYQHLFKGKPLPDFTVPDGPTPGMHLNYLDYPARLMTWYSLKTGNAAYFDAFIQCAHAFTMKRNGAYHHGTSLFLLIPWMQDQLWQATLSDDGVHITATHMGERTPKTATIMTPDGPRTVEWTAPGVVTAPPDIHVKTRTLSTNSTSH